MFKKIFDELADGVVGAITLPIKVVDKLFEEADVD